MIYAPRNPTERTCETFLNHWGKDIKDLLDCTPSFIQRPLLCRAKSRTQTTHDLDRCQQPYCSILPKHKTSRKLTENTETSGWKPHHQVGCIRIKLTSEVSCDFQSFRPSGVAIFCSMTNLANLALDVRKRLTLQPFWLLIFYTPIK